MANVEGPLESKKAAMDSRWRWVGKSCRHLVGTKFLSLPYWFSDSDWDCVVLSESLSNVTRQ